MLDMVFLLGVYIFGNFVRSPIAAVDFMLIYMVVYVWFSYYKRAKPLIDELVQLQAQLDYLDGEKSALLAIMPSPSRELN